jgi:hypothetical protein
MAGLPRRSVALLLAALVGGGCASAAAPPGAHLGAASPMMLESGIMIRATAPPRTAGTDVPVFVCVDPSLDVTLVLADSILGGAPRGANRDAGVVELARRVHAEAAALRSTLSQLCGEWGRNLARGARPAPLDAAPTAGLRGRGTRSNGVEAAPSLTSPAPSSRE